MMNPNQHTYARSFAVVVAVLAVVTPLALLAAQCSRPVTAMGQDSMSAPEVATAPTPRAVATGAASRVELLALACFAEATLKVSDCAAINGVVSRLAKRRGTAWEKQLRDYTAVDRCKRVPTDREWTWHKNVAQGVLDGEISDPCPSAMHFGGLRNDADRANAAKMVHAGKWRVAWCDRPTVNTFFAEVRQ
jgi:hypothetical protein